MIGYDKNRGFTLIEVLVAMVILGLACAALFGLLSRSLLNLRKLEDIHRYQIAAEDVMNRVQVLVKFPPEATVTGRPDNLDAEWKVTVSPWFPATFQEKPSQAIVKINVDVTWKGASAQHQVRLETIKPASIVYENYDLQQALEKNFPR